MIFIGFMRKVTYFHDIQFDYITDDIINEFIVTKFTL